MLSHQIAAPNSPQWFNTGLYSVYGTTGSSQGHYYYDEKKHRVVKSKNSYERPQIHACFILPVNDDLVNEGGIFDLVTKEARLFKYGSGSGTNFSPIRGKSEKLSGGGVSSGLLSFLKINDRAASAIKSGGSVRRASRITILDADHPDIEEFIDWKPNEEYKVSTMVVGSNVIRRHIENIKIALRDFLVNSNKEKEFSNDDMFNIEVNTALKKA
jgi:ribonucleoside-diphosphate reductase alpha chain